MNIIQYTVSLSDSLNSSDIEIRPQNSSIIQAIFWKYPLGLLEIMIRSLFPEILYTKQLIC